MKKALLVLLAVLMVLYQIPGGVLAMAEENTESFSPESLGTWMWDVTDILRLEESLEFLQSHHVTEVYLSWSRAMPKAKYRAFIKACAKENIRVGLIGAEAEWAVPQGQKAFDNYLKWLKEYQVGCESPEEKFYGMHMDVEPHQLPQWQTGQQAVVDGYAAFLQKARAACDKLGCLLEADIPFWFDGFDVELNGQSMKLCEAVIRLCDTTLLMSYRDNAPAIMACGDMELPLGKALGKKIILAVETGKIYESVNVTFHHMGTKALYRELNALQDLVSARDDVGEVGYAIHYFASWRGLPEDGYPKGPDYPYAD